MTPISIDIPEILILVSVHLGLEDIVHCTLVNKVWYTVFAPLCFREINSSNARSAALERYCPHATRLIISMTSPIFNIIAPKCTHLTELQVRGPGSSTTSISKTWIAFLQSNPRINKVTSLELTPESLSVLTEHCPNLQELVVRGFEFGYHREGAKSNGTLVSPLWRIAQGLSSLDLGFNSFTVHMNALLPCPDPAGLPMLRHLVLGASYSSLLDQTRLISAAKNLESLAWDMEHVRMGETGVQTCREMFASLQHLQDLRLFLPEKQIFLRGDELVEFLILLPPCVKELHVPSYSPWRITDVEIHGSLSQQFPLLEVLNLRGWNVASMVDVVLCSCRRLRVLDCYTLRASSMIETPEVTPVSDENETGSRGVGPLGWVCSGLETLNVRFVDCKDDKARRCLFDQLCCMKELKSVIVGGLDPVRIHWQEGEIPKTWGALGHVKDEISDIPWMRETWPRLESFRTYGKAS
ncbi:hypothetical protein EMPS_07355 [Entomortierella parvispora]|uniref:F-box domain-containing protein n=1 Tax=Entomortierella parvispora TaxID=205924 RepID=A0A9P3HE76_9FUNG|nr:hypothetical protein EMPS_07355 [Entomortierella parvispora]